MTWFGWILVFWWIISFTSSVYVAGKNGELSNGKFKQSVGSLLFGAVLNLIFIVLVFTVGTGYGL